MSKKVTAYKVKSLNKVKTSHYIEGDLFMTNRTVGILVDGKIKVFSMSSPNLKDYVKREEVEEMINEIVGKVDKDGTV